MDFVEVKRDQSPKKAGLEVTGEAIAGLYTDPVYRMQEYDNYLIGHMGCAYPTRIELGWQRLQRIEVVERGRVVPLGVKVEIEDYVLIS